MAEVKWIKILVDIFDDEAIKLIEQMPDGDTLLVIWFKLLAKAGKTNDGGLVYLKENIPYTDEILATVFNKPIATIRLAMQTFKNLGMVELTSEHQILIRNWEKHQNIEGMEQIRTYNRLAKQKQRAKEKELKLLQCQNMSKNVNDMSLTSQKKEIDNNENVIDCHETDIDIDKDKELDNNTITIITPEQKNEILHDFYGEYCNVGLTQAQYGKLLAFILDKKTLDNLIETFGKKIETGDEKKFTTELPNLHYERLLAYWKFMKENPQKFFSKKNNTEGAPADKKESFSLNKLFGKGA